MYEMSIAAHNIIYMYVAYVRMYVRMLAFTYVPTCVISTAGSNLEIVP